MGEVASIAQHPRFRREREPLLSKRELHLRLTRSTRWIEQRVAEGMPSYLDGNGYRRFRLSEVTPWLKEHGYVVSDRLGAAQ